MQVCRYDLTANDPLRGMFTYEYAAVFFLHPILTLWALLLVLPVRNRAGLLSVILLCVIGGSGGSFLLSFIMYTGGSARAEPFLYCELAGTIVGAGLATVYVLLKSRKISN
jgi:hypothetical protein